MNLIILGPQGAGKGTQAKLLAEKFNLEYFETGKLLRETAKENTDLGKHVASRINRGFIVDALTITKILRRGLEDIPKEKGVVFDGIPRDESQIKAFEKALKAYKRKITYAFFIWISRKEPLKRLTKRRICKKCNSFFILGKTLKPGVKKCPKCGGEIYQREDDKSKVIEKRLEQYYQKTLPVIRYYYLKRKMIEINGEQSINKVFKDILAYIE